MFMIDFVFIFVLYLHTLTFVLVLFWRLIYPMIACILFPRNLISYLVPTKSVNKQNEYTIGIKNLDTLISCQYVVDQILKGVWLVHR